MTERWRCFVAVPLGDTLRSTLADAVDSWRREPPADALRWSDPSAWHVTLAFLGPVDAASVPSIAGAARSVAARHAPMCLAAEGLGSFPGPARARVAWYAILDPADRLTGLARDLGAVLGVDVGNPFRPHVTLARARREPVDLRRWLTDAAATAPTATIEVDRIELMRSHLGRGPAAYETLASIPLTGASA